MFPRRVSLKEQFNGHIDRTVGLYMPIKNIGETVFSFALRDFELQYKLHNSAYDEFDEQAQHRYFTLRHFAGAAVVSYSFATSFEKLSRTVYVQAREGERTRRTYESPSIITLGDLDKSTSLSVLALIANPIAEFPQIEVVTKIVDPDEAKRLAEIQRGIEKARSQHATGS